MNEIGTLFAHHPWWMVAAILFPIGAASWVIVGAAVLEKRHGGHIFAGRE